MHAPHAALLACLLAETDFYDVHSWWRATDPGRADGQGASLDPWCHGPYWSYDLAVGVLRSYGMLPLLACMTYIACLPSLPSLFCLLAWITWRCLPCLLSLQSYLLPLSPLWLSPPVTSVVIGGNDGSFLIRQLVETQALATECTTSSHEILALIDGKVLRLPLRWTGVDYCLVLTELPKQVREAVHSICRGFVIFVAACQSVC